MRFLAEWSKFTYITSGGMLSLQKRKLPQAIAVYLIMALLSPKGNLKPLQAQFIHVAMILQRAIEDGEEELAVMFNILQLQVFHGNGLSAIVVGDDFQGAFFGNVTRLGLEGPEVGIEGDMHAREFGQIRRTEIAEAILSIHDLTT